MNISSSAKGNILVMQSGGCTPVLNRSLFGVFHEASQHSSFGEIYGAVHGLEGILSNSLLDLRKQSNETWDRIAQTPAAALGSTRRKLRGEDVSIISDALTNRNIRYWFIIGGNDSAETGHTMSQEFKASGRSLSVINVPKTIDNDLILTDHSPGYGSAARFVALATMGAGRDAEAMSQASPVTIIEVMGRDAGWLAASAALAKQDARDAPHVICIPEVPVDENRFLERIESIYRRFGFAVAVIAENTRGIGGVLGGNEEPWYVDDFGHPYYDGPARYLAGLVGRHLKIRVRHEKPGTIQRSMMSCLSNTDAEEAEMAGRAAVRYALDGHTDKMVTLVREPDDPYSCTTSLAPLEEVAGQVKVMPEEYLDAPNFFVTEEFVKYVQPLIGAPLPQFGRVR